MTSPGFSANSTTYAGPASVVYDHVTKAHAYASDAFADAILFLNKLASYAPQILQSDINVNFPAVPSGIDDFNVPDIPVSPNITVVLPTFPDAFEPGDIHEFDESNIGTVPLFNITEPTITIPATPGDLDVTAPGDAPGVTTSFTFPTAPDDTLPSVPTLEELSLPTADSVVIPTFAMAAPDVNDLPAVPGNIFSFVEIPYTSTLMTELKAELLDRITNGGTGLNVAVETAIWNRARSREEQNALRAEYDLLVGNPQVGFSRPAGALIASLDKVRQDTQHKIADLSREIALKQADLEQKNMEFALNASLQLETNLLENSNKVQERAFEVEKYVQGVAIDLFKVQVSKIQTQAEIYKAYAGAFESRVRAELGKIEIFKAEIDAQKLIGDINEQAIKVYLARVDAVKTAAEIYKTQVDAIQSRINAEGLKLQVYKTEVEAYAVQVGAKRDEYSMFAERVKAELAKTNVYDSQVKAFISRVDAYAKQVDAEATRSELDIKVEESRLQRYLAELDASVKTAQVQQLVSSAAVDVFKGQAALFSAQVDAEASRVGAQQKVFELGIEQAKAETQIALQEAQINVENARNSVTLLLEAAKAGATVASNLAASSLSAMNIGASISGSSSDMHYYTEK